MSLHSNDILQLRIIILNEIKECLAGHAAPEVIERISTKIRNAEADQMELAGNKEQADTHRRLIPEF